MNPLERCQVSGVECHSALFALFLDSKYLVNVFSAHSITTGLWFLHFSLSLLLETCDSGLPDGFGQKL